MLNIFNIVKKWFLKFNELFYVGSTDKLPPPLSRDEEEYFTCDNCGAKVNEDANKCPKCGAVFDEEIEEDKEEKEIDKKETKNKKEKVV